jgi:hypothetical protein
MADKQPKEARRVSPTDELARKRAAWSNGKDPNQCSDTIGKLWAWNLLLSERHDSDVLRDAGREYADCYWRHYQRTAAAKIGGYREMLGGSIAPLHIPDPVRDVLQEERFRKMDAELGGPGSRERRAVMRYCVEQHGDNDPTWLRDVIEGFPSQTQERRNNITFLKLQCFSKDKDIRAAAKKALEREERTLEREVRGLGVAAQGRDRDLPELCQGLTWLADHLAREKRAKQAERALR